MSLAVGGFDRADAILFKSPKGKPIEQEKPDVYDHGPAQSCAISVWRIFLGAMVRPRAPRRPTLSCTRVTPRDIGTTDR